MNILFLKILTDNSQIKIVYVLLDGVGDLPHPDINNKTPLQAAKTPNMDKLAKNGKMGEVISVGKGIAPESDIAVFNMLGYKFHHADYAGRGVIEAIGTGIDFKDGDLALRGNFSTLDEKDVIIDRRAGRHIERDDAKAVSEEIEQKLKFSSPLATVVVAPTIGHRVVVRIRDERPLSANISNTDPAYSRIDGMGIAKRFIYSQIHMEKYGNKVMFKSQNLNYNMKDENYKQLIDNGSLLFIEIVNNHELNIVYSFSIDLGEVLPKYLENYIGILIKKLFYRVKMHFNNI